MELDEYTLWLEPEGDSKIALQKYIDDFALRAGTFPFPPHLTLVGGITLDEASVKKLTEQLSFGYSTFKVQSGKIGSTNQFYKSVFIEYTSDALLHLNREAQKLFSKMYTYQPHVSVLYGEVDQTLKDTFITELSDASASFDFEVNSISLWRAKGTYPDWKKVASFPLGAK